MIDYKKLSSEAIEEFFEAWAPGDDPDSLGHQLIHELRTELICRRARVLSQRQVAETQRLVASMSLEEAKRRHLVDDDVLYI